MALADDNNAEVPIGHMFRQEPTRCLRTDLHRLLKSITGGARPVCGGPAKTVNPFWRRVRSEQAVHFLMEAGGPRRGVNTGVMRSPGGDAANPRGLRDITIGNVKDYG